MKFVTVTAVAGIAGIFAAGCGGKEAEPRSIITPISPPTARATEAPRSTLLPPTAERGMSVPIEVSAGVRAKLGKTTLSALKLDMMRYFSLFRCAANSVNLTTHSEGQGNPGDIMLDLEAIQDTERSYGLPTGLLARSTILQALSITCYDALHFESQTYDIGGGFKLRTEPGLRMVFIEPNGKEQENQSIVRGISGALASIITQEGFATASVSDANVVTLTRALINSTEDAQIVSDLMYSGDFSSFVTFVRGRSPVQIKKEDMQAVLTWYGKANNAQSQKELDNVINEMLQSRGKELNIKTNYKTDHFNEMSLTQLKRRYKETRDGIILQEINRRKSNTRKNKRREVKRNDKLRQEAVLERTAAFARHGAVV